MTPEGIDSDVERLMTLLGIHEKPVYIELTPEHYAQPCECFPAVAEKIRLDGGSQQLGWQIWKTNILVEAEFHAVWRSPDGVLFDITPKQEEVDRILFLPDRNTTYDGRQVDNVRLNITDNRLVDEFIEVDKARFRFQNKGTRAYEYEVSLTPQEFELYWALTTNKEGIYAMIREGKTRNCECFCGSGKKYKHCHGNRMLDALGAI